MDSIKQLFTAILYQPLFNALIFLAWLIPGHSIGWAIIALTIFIRLLLFPSSLKTFEQQRRIQALQPKMNELKEKHGEDKAAHSKAVMELYATERVNPLGGCLPMLAQLPILIGLYQVFIHGLSTEQFHLLYPFTPHLSTINTSWYGLDLSKPEPWVLPILTGILQYVQAKQMMPTMPKSTSGEPDVSQMMQRQMLYIFPLITVFIVRGVPAALGLYWITTTIFSIIQQWWIMRRPISQKEATKLLKGGVRVTVRKKSKDHDE